MSSRKRNSAIIKKQKEHDFFNTDYPLTEEVDRSLINSLGRRDLYHDSGKDKVKIRPFSMLPEEERIGFDKELDKFAKIIKKNTVSVDYDRNVEKKHKQIKSAIVSSSSNNNNNSDSSSESEEEKGKKEKENVDGNESEHFNLDDYLESGSKNKTESPVEEGAKKKESAVIEEDEKETENRDVVDEIDIIIAKKDHNHNSGIKAPSRCKRMCLRFDGSVYSSKFLGRIGMNTVFDEYRYNSFENYMTEYFNKLKKEEGGDNSTVKSNNNNNSSDKIKGFELQGSDVDDSDEGDEIRYIRDDRIPYFSFANYIGVDKTEETDTLEKKFNEADNSTTTDHDIFSNKIKRANQIVMSDVGLGLIMEELYTECTLSCCSIEYHPLGNEENDENVKNQSNPTGLLSASGDIVHHNETVSNNKKNKKSESNKKVKKDSYIFMNFELTTDAVFYLTVCFKVLDTGTTTGKVTEDFAKSKFINWLEMGNVNTQEKRDVLKMRLSFKSYSYFVCECYRKQCKKS